MKSEIGTLFALHILLMVYSASGVLAKLAGAADPFSFDFFFYYGLMLGVLVVYAIGWQQILKRVPLTTAFSNKAATIIWGVVWGFIFFNEPINMAKALGAGIIVVGIVMYTNADSSALRKEKDKPIDLSEPA